MRPQALALSPDGKVLVAAGKTNDIVVLDPVSGEVIKRVELPDEGMHEPPTDQASTNILKPDKKGQVSLHRFDSLFRWASLVHEQRQRFDQSLQCSR